MNLPLDRRPVVVAIAGPNGAGKTTFYFSHIQVSGLRFVNADVLARELSVDPYTAARIADSMRREFIANRESFAFETVFSDPIGEKLDFLNQASEAGYNVILCFIGIASSAVSEQRVAMRISQGGHDVPSVKLVDRFPRTLANLKSALLRLPKVWVFDNSDLRTPFRLVAVSENGAMKTINKPLPKWLKTLLPEEANRRSK